MPPTHLTHVYQDLCYLCYHGEDAAQPPPKTGPVTLSRAVEIIRRDAQRSSNRIKWISFHITFYVYEFPRREADIVSDILFFPPFFLVKYIDLYMSMYIKM